MRNTRVTVYQSGYTQSYAVLISSWSSINPKSAKLAEVLEKQPYNFQVTRLFGDSVRQSAIEDALNTLQDIDSDSRILLLIDAEISESAEGSNYLVCSDSDQSNLANTAFPLEKFFQLPEISPAKHIVLIFDQHIDLAKIERFIQLGAPHTNNVTQYKSYQFMMCAPDSKRSLTSILLSYLSVDVYVVPLTDPITVYSIVYYSQAVFPSFHLYLKGSDRGDFVFYGSPEQPS